MHNAAIPPRQQSLRRQLHPRHQSVAEISFRLYMLLINGSTRQLSGSVRAAASGQRDD